ncbi:MAG: 5-formyltetrahydrofolate cyclo-ligase [Peptococcaceae bacterium]|nr:5-formyltetrahydrofolate cyclo-ligase [Peptococcaceae bacterium]
MYLWEGIYLCINREEIRKRILTLRYNLSPPLIEEKSELIFDKILNSQTYKGAKSLMVYIDFKNEVKTEGLINRALDDGKIVSVPITDIKERRLTPSRIIDYADDLAPGVWGISEPKPDRVRPVDPRELDLIIVPGVSFDIRGNRLGYGAGFYDRFLLRTKSEAMFVAVSFDMQIVDNIFPAEHDVPVHFIVTEKRIIGNSREL